MDFARVEEKVKLVRKKIKKEYDSLVEKKGALSAPAEYVDLTADINELALIHNELAGLPDVIDDVRRGYDRLGHRLTSLGVGGLRQSLPVSVEVSASSRFVAQAGENIRNMISRIGDLEAFVDEFPAIAEAIAGLRKALQYKSPNDLIAIKLCLGRVENAVEIAVEGVDARSSELSLLMRRVRDSLAMIDIVFSKVRNPEYASLQDIEFILPYVSLAAQALAPAEARTPVEEQRLQRRLDALREAA